MINRRDFLKTTAATTFVATGVGQSLAPSAQAYSGTAKSKVVKIIATTCEMCKAHCPMVATVYKDGTVALAGNKNNPIHGPFLCSRGLAATQLLSHPDRLKYPMKRVGVRGSGKWRRISWDTAVQEIGRHIRKSYAEKGGDGLALFAGGRSSHHIKSLFKNVHCHLISDSSYDHSLLIRTLGFGTTFGMIPDPALIDLHNSKCIVLLGSHLGENVFVPQIRQFTQALERDDVEVVVVDPRFSAAAAKAQHYLSIKPGTDTALLLGWIHYLIENDLYDRGFVESSCLGFTELRRHVAGYSLERTAAITDLPKAHIAGIAEIMGQAGAATTLVPGNQLSWYGNDVSRVRALAILSALLGAVPQEAGLDFDFTQMSKPVDTAMTLGQIRSGKIGVVGIWGQNVLQSEAPAYFVSQALKEAEFTFCTDIFPSETSLYADIILPEASFLERADFCETWVTAERKVVAGSFAVQAPLAGCRSPFKIVKAIAAASGFKDQFSLGLEQDLYGEQAKQLHISLNGLVHAGGVVVFDCPPDMVGPVDGKDASSDSSGEMETQTEMEAEADTEMKMKIEAVEPLVAAPVQVFKTPSGKVELSSSWLARNGYTALPDFMEPMTVPDGFTRLLSGRCPVHTLTRTSGNRWLNHEISENILWLSEVGAATYNVKSGQHVRLENSDGVKSVNRIEIMVTPGIRDDCCYASHGFGNLSPLMSEGYNKGVSVNRLLSRSTPDVVSGVRGLRDIFVRLIRD